MIRLLLAAVLLSLASTSSSLVLQPGACPGRTALPSFAGKNIFVMADTLLFATPDIQLDIDGHRRAYGVRDQGVENICNGLAPLRPPECRGRVRGTCYRHCQAAFRSWNGLPEDLGNVMCSVGLGGGSCGVPAVRLQSAPNQQWFVSETSVHPAPPAGTSLGDWLRRQDAQLDSADIPYFVIPGGFRRLPWDATPGDVGIVVAADGRTIPFIIGDTGGALNEGSAKLLAGLRGLQQLPTTRARNAFGVEVDRLTGAMSGDFRVAIFRHSAQRLPGQSSVLSLAAADIPAFIERVALERLERIGGPAGLRRCSRQ
jgi:hypothetical protein